MRLETIYICEYCGENFNNTDSCTKHESVCKKSKENEVVLHKFVGEFCVPVMAGSFVKNEISAYLYNNDSYYDSIDNYYLLKKSALKQPESWIDNNYIRFELYVAADSFYDVQMIFQMFEFEVRHKLTEIVDNINKYKHNLRIEKVNI